MNTQFSVNQSPVIAGGTQYESPAVPTLTKEENQETFPFVVREDSYLQGNIELIIGDIEHLVHEGTNLNQSREELEALVQDLRCMLVD